MTDEEGRYRLEGMPIGADNRIAAIAPMGDVAYFSMSQRASTTSQEHPLEVDFDLISGVWIEGRITDKQTGKGLLGRLAYYVKKESPNYKSPVRSALTSATVCCPTMTDASGLPLCRDLGLSRSWPTSIRTIPAPT